MIKKCVLIIRVVAIGTLLIGVAVGTVLNYSED